MKICAIGDPHGNLNAIKKIHLKGVDLIFLTGDLGKADFARQRFFENMKREKEGLDVLDYDADSAKKVWDEIHYSTISVLEYLSKHAPVYSLLGNVGTNMVKDSEHRKEEEKWGIKLPSFKEGLNSVKNFYLVRNRLRKIKNLRVGFLEFFADVSWVKEFKPKDYQNKLDDAKEETEKAKSVLKWFNSLDILVCHQPPYGVLDKVTSRYNPPKGWAGKHAGSKVILEYIKKYQPRYVFCGHIHEGEGMKKIGKTEVYNLGVAGHKIIELD